MLLKFIGKYVFKIKCLLTLFVLKRYQTVLCNVGFKLPFIGV